MCQGHLKTSLYLFLKPALSTPLFWITYSHSWLKPFASLVPWFYRYCIYQHVQQPFLNRSHAYAKYNTIGTTTSSNKPLLASKPKVLQLITHFTAFNTKHPQYMHFIAHFISARHLRIVPPSNSIWHWTEYIECTYIHSTDNFRFWFDRSKKHWSVVMLSV